MGSIHSGFPQSCTQYGQSLSQCNLSLFIAIICSGACCRIFEVLWFKFGTWSNISASRQVAESLECRHQAVSERSAAIFQKEYCRNIRCNQSILILLLFCQALKPLVHVHMYNVITTLAGKRAASFVFITIILASLTKAESPPLFAHEHTAGSS